MMGRIAAAALAIGALAACKPVEASQIDNPSAAGEDVVVAAGTSRSGEHTEYYVECGPDQGAWLGDYKVMVPAEVSYTALPGTPCPDGPREPMPQDTHPELFAEMSEAMNEPLPYEGGDIATCGEWATDDPEWARQQAQECPPLTKGELP